jgi:KaiC/GvpD/RAD55 family RecA-like ATPase
MRMDRMEQLIEKLERQNKSEIVDAIVRERQPIPEGARRVLVVVERVVSVGGLSEQANQHVR